MRARARYLLGALLALALATTVVAEGPFSFSSLLTRGELAISAKNYGEAVTMFHRADSAASTPAEHDIAIFSYAKALYYSGNLTDAGKAFARHRQDFPSSKNLTYGRYFEANIALLAGKSEQAGALLIKTYLDSEDPRLETLALASLKRLFAAYPECELVIDSQLARHTVDKRCRLVNELATTMLQLHRVGDATALHRLCPNAADGIAAQGDSLTVAMLVPLSGELQEFGEAVYLGGVTAAQLATATNNIPIRILPFDTKGDPVIAGRLARELQNTDVDIVVGPLTSDEAAVVAAALSCTDLPVLTPAASKSGISLLSPRAFQLTPSLELQAIALADYAYHTLKAKTTAILAPAETDYISMAGAFADRFEKLGGKVIGREFYLTREKDFKNHILSIKELARGRTLDSAVYVNDRGDTLEADAVPAEVDCMFLPGSPEQLRQLLPQVNYYGLRARYLGSDSWGDDVVLGLGNDVLKGAVFTSPFLRVGESPAYTQFETLYEGNFNTKPNRLASLGYDAVSLLVAAAAKGTDRDGLMRGLTSLGQFSGATGGISFSSWRENMILPIYQIADGRAIPIGLSVTSAGSGPSNRQEDSDDPE